MPAGSSTASQETTSSASPPGSDNIVQRDGDLSVTPEFVVSDDDGKTLRQMLREDPDLRDMMRKAGLSDTDSDEFESDESNPEINL